MAEIEITKENFIQEVLKSEVPVLLDFWAIWCGPCIMQAPILTEMAEEYEGRLKIGKVNIDEQPELANLYNIQSIPTLVVMKQGKVANATMGVHTKEQILFLLRRKVQ